MQYDGLVTASELKRLLKSKGCTFLEATRHTRVFYGSESTTIPRHPSQEVKKGTVAGVFKQLGLKR